MCGRSSSTFHGGGQEDNTHVSSDSLGLGFTHIALNKHTRIARAYDISIHRPEVGGPLAALSFFFQNSSNDSEAQPGSKEYGSSRNHTRCCQLHSDMSYVRLHSDWGLWWTWQAPCAGAGSTKHNHL